MTRPPKISLLELAVASTDQFINLSEADLINHAQSAAQYSLPNQTLAILKEAAHRFSSSAKVWVALIEFLIDQDLFCSALKVLDDFINAFPDNVSIAQFEKTLAIYRSVPSISLYVPCYNDSASIGPVIEALLGQSIRAAEIVVVDDCSTDDSCRIIEKYPVKLIRHDVNLGPGAARNSALHNATGTLVGSIDADVIADRFWLERLLIGLLDGDYAGVSGYLCEHYSVAQPDLWRSEIMRLHHDSIDQVDVIQYGANGLFQSAVMRAVDGYSTQYARGFEDIDLCNKLRRAGFHTKYIHRALAYHQRTDTIESVLRNCHNWRREPHKRASFYQSAETLLRIWRSSTKLNLDELTGLIQGKRYSLLYPTYLNFFWPLVADLGEFLSISATKDRVDWSALALVTIKQAIVECTSGFSKLKQAILSDLEPLLVDLPEQELTPDFELIGPVGDLVSLLALPKDLLATIECNSRLHCDTVSSWASKELRVAVIEVEYLLHWRKKSAVKREQNGSELNKLFEDSDIHGLYIDFSNPLRNETDLIEQIGGYSPDITVLATDSTDCHTLAEGFLLLKERPGTVKCAFAWFRQPGLDPAHEIRLRKFVNQICLGPAKTVVNALQLARRVI